MNGHQTNRIIIASYRRWSFHSTIFNWNRYTEWEKNKHQQLRNQFKSEFLCANVIWKCILERSRKRKRKRKEKFDQSPSIHHTHAHTHTHHACNTRLWRCCCEYDVGMTHGKSVKRTRTHMYSSNLILWISISVTAVKSSSEETKQIAFSCPVRNQH